MNYLSFQPAFDVLHTEFRFLRLRRLMSADNPWRYDQLRVADFYLLFFFRLKDARLSPKHRALKKLASLDDKSRYEYQPDDQLLFSRMEKVQFAAMGTLISKDFFDKEYFTSDLVIETPKQEPELLAQRIDEINQTQVGRLEAIQSLVTDYNFLGPDGLKARTGLLEYKYDAI